MQPELTIPKNLDPLARELLESLAGNPEAAEIVIGGGVALSHYLEYRPTVDLDAWWKGEPREEVLTFVEQKMRDLAARHGLDYRRRTWGETESLEVLQGSKKRFSFQISNRTLFLDEAISAGWKPMWIETLRDNVASKMTALVARGAPRDFADIYELVGHKVVSLEDCWEFWRAKNLQISVSEAKRKVATKLHEIALRRPLDHSVYPDLESPPDEVTTIEDRADYVHRICGAFDFGIFPEESDWELFRDWKDVFDRFPIRDSPGYHVFRQWFGWEQIGSEKRLDLPAWKISDLREGREDLCEELV